MSEDKPFEIQEQAPIATEHRIENGYRILANIISYVFHPMLFPVYSFFFINACYPFLFAHLDKVERMRLFMVLLTNTILFPGITMIMIKQLGFAKSLKMRNRKERILPYIAMCVFSFWTFMVIRKLAVGDMFTHVMLGSCFSIFMAFFFNNFYKISIHAVGAGSFVAIALVVTMASNYNLVAVFLLMILLAGVIGTARLYLKAHTFRDIYTGYMVGVLAQMIAFKFF